MKKAIALVMAALLAVTCLFALVGCGKEEVKENTEYSYIITGQFNGWGVPADGATLKAEYKMTAIAANDPRVASIKALVKDAKYLYVIDHTCVGEGAGWTFGYALTAGAAVTNFDGNQAIKVIKTKYEVEGDVAAWTQEWLPDAGNTTFKSLTPDTLYMPPHSEHPTYENSGAWNDNPAILVPGEYVIVFAEFADGTFGLGAIKK